MASPWIDVSVTLKTGMASWLGDPPARISRDKDLERGDACTVSLLEMGAHTGTHMDAPAHFVRGGAGIDEAPLDAGVGAARVIPIRDRESIKPGELERHAIGTPAAKRQAEACGRAREEVRCPGRATPSR